VSQNKEYAYFQGNFVPLEEANVNIRTHAFMYGTGVFEGMRGNWNEREKQMYVFRMREHYQRMQYGMKIMDMELKYSIEEMEALTVELLKRNNCRSDTYVRASVYKSNLTIGVTLHDNPCDFYLFAVPFGDYFRGSGGALKAAVSTWRRVLDTAIPNTKIVGSYANVALAKKEAQTHGYDECIVLTESGHVSEGSAMNLFMVKAGRLITPPNSDCILPGITRASVMEIAEEEFGIATDCRSISRTELYTADELFFTGNAAHVAPIVSVDKRTVGQGVPGPITCKLKDTYVDIIRGELPKYRKWVTPVYPVPVTTQRKTATV
jgi:branched-chain amino acid aminotransferase